MRGSSFFWLLLSLLGIALVLLVLRNDAGTVMGLANDNFARAVFLVAVLAFLIYRFRGRTGGLATTLRFAAIWGVLLFVVLLGYTYRAEIEAVFERVAGEVLPGTAVVQTGDAGNGQVVVSRDRGGHFTIVTTVNNASFPMMIDTGASVITLSAEDARLAGFQSRNLDYRVEVATANGTALAAPVVLTRVAVGSIELRRVSALVAQPGMLDSSLLGLNFLNALESFTISGNRMTLVP